MTTTPNGVPLLSADEQNPDLVVNQIALLVDTIRSPVVDRSLTAPPSTPDESKVYIPSATATGEWAGQENNIAKFNNSSWTFYTPLTGWTFYSLADSAFILFNGTGWSTI